MKKMIKDYIRFAMGTFRARKIRSFLTMLGIFVGIAAIVSLISLGQGLEKTITEQFEALGTNKIIVAPAGTFFGVGGEAVSKLTKDDLEVIRKVRGVNLAGGMLYKIARVEFNDEVKYTWVIGLPLDESRKVIEEIGTFKYTYGRELKDGDQYKAAVGYLLSEDDFFEQAVGIGDKLKVENQEFKVVGSLARIGNPQDDSQVYLPLETAREAFAEPTKLDFIML